MSIDTSFIDEATGLVDVDAVLASNPGPRRPKELQAAAENDPIAKALNSNYDPQGGGVDPSLPPFVPLHEKWRQQSGPTVPYGWQDPLFAVVKPWHRLSDDPALAKAHDALLSAVGKAEAAAESLLGLDDERRAERADIEQAAKAAARRGEPLPDVERTDWELRKIHAETTFTELRKAAGAAAQSYASVAKRISPDEIIAKGEAVKAAKTKHLAAARKLAAEVAELQETDALIGQAAAALHIGPRWNRGRARSSGSKATGVSPAKAAQSLVDFLSGGSMVDLITDGSTTLPMSTREWLLSDAGERGWDLLARLESVEGYKVSSFTHEHAKRYEGATLSSEERTALQRRELPL